MVRDRHHRRSPTRPRIGATGWGISVSRTGEIHLSAVKGVADRLSRCGECVKHLPDSMVWESAAHKSRLGGAALPVGRAARESLPLRRLRQRAGGSRLRGLARLRVAQHLAGSRRSLRAGLPGVPLGHLSSPPPVCHLDKPAPGWSDTGVRPALGHLVGASEARSARTGPRTCCWACVARIIRSDRGVIGVDLRCRHAGTRRPQSVTRDSVMGSP